MLEAALEPSMVQDGNAPLLKLLCSPFLKVNPLLQSKNPGSQLPPNCVSQKDRVSLGCAGLGCTSLSLLHPTEWGWWPSSPIQGPQ